MTPKEKAIRLHSMNKAYLPSGIEPNLFNALAVKFAEITVDEILNALHDYDENTESIIKESSFQVQNMERDWNYWELVRKEISLL